MTAAALMAAGTAGAQATSPTMSDATVVARGAVRLRGAVEWTRIDGTFGPDGAFVRPLGGSLTAILDAAALPLLASPQTAARNLADQGLTFNAGQLTTAVDSRVASVPLGIEYGLTSRITVGALIPIVQSRSVVSWQLNGRGDSLSGVNVGTNPAGFFGSTAAYSANAGVANALAAARDQLQARLGTCAASPFSTGCPELNARRNEANALISSTTIFAAGIGTLYGVNPSDAPGAPFVPLTGSAIQAAIDARLGDLRASYTSFGFNAGTGALAAAQAPAANAQFDSILTRVDYGIELDSLGSTQQLAIGDIELGVTALLFNTFNSRGPIRLRAAAAGVVRLGTGHAARANRPYDVPTGDGQTDFEARGALDAMIGSRLFTTVAGTYTVQTGTVATTRLPSAPDALFGLDFPVEGTIKHGNMASLRVNPRFLLTPALMVGAIGVGSYRAGDEVTVLGFNPNGTVFGNQASSTSYAGGLTLSYSNLASVNGIGGPRFPAEIVFTHLETLGASAAGVEKGTRDAIELRFYLRARR